MSPPSVVTDTVVAVLVTPADGDPGGLLAEGRCGATPPVAVLRSCREGHKSWELGVCDDPRCRRARGQLGLLRVLEVDRALPLWWDGALVPEGWDRLRRAVPGMEDCPSDPTQHGGAAYIIRMIEVYDDLPVRRVCHIIRLARVDGRLVEVTPWVDR